MSDGEKDPKDLTRLEDLSEFLHEEDPELEERFGDFQSDSASESSESTEAHISSTEDLSFTMPEDSDDALPADLFSPSSEVNDELSEVSSFEETSSEESDPFSFEASISDELNAIDDSPFELSTPEVNAEESPLIEDDYYSSPTETETETEAEETLPPMASERFEEVRDFTQNFSYGHILGGGNPPFSIVIRNIKFSEDAEDIKIILREFGLITSQNEADIEKSLEFGSLLVPQISEYSAIVLAHKLRRFDCDLEVGLSDEVHPARSGDTNPRGLSKKESLKQNRAEAYKKSEKEIAIDDIIVSTTATLEGHSIQKYIGVHTSFTIVDEEELERLKFVQKARRSQSELYTYPINEDENNEANSEVAFNQYQNSFDLLFIDLCDQLKTTAAKEKANALLRLQYQLTSLPFEKNNQGKNCYQLTCSATLAVVVAE